MGITITVITPLSLITFGLFTYCITPGRYVHFIATRKTDVLDPIFSMQVRAYSSKKSWRLQFHNSELYFRTRPPNLYSQRC